MADALKGPNSFDPNSNQLSWKMGPRDFVLKHIRYIPLILISSAIGLILAYLNIRYTTPIFSVQSSLLINNEGNNSNKGERFDMMFMNQGSVNLSNEIQILSSRPVLQRVVRNLDLSTRYYNIGKIRTTLLYPFSPITVKEVALVSDLRSYSVQITVLNENQFQIGKETKMHLFGESLNVEGATIAILRNQEIPLSNYASPSFAIAHDPAANVANEFLGSLRISQANDQATILTLYMSMENTELGRDFLNALMKVYDSLNIEGKNRISINSLNFINTNLDTLQLQLNRLEGKGKNIRLANDIFDEQDQSKMYLDHVQESKSDLDKLDVRISIANRLQQYVNDLDKGHDLVPINMGIEEPALLALISQYNRLQLERDNNLKTTTSDNPLIRALDATLEKLRHNISEALNNVKNGYEIAREKLVEQQSQIVSRLRLIPGKTIELGNVGRSQKILEDLYSFLLQKKFETSISYASTVSNSTVVEPALASSGPISPNKGKIYSMYLIFGLIIPIGIIALMEIIKDKVTGRIDVEKRTHAPILGEIGHSEDDTTLVVLRNSRRFIAEQFRILRSNLRYMTGEKENPCILVTSSFSGEGKSFISINLASAIALSGKKTVLMEFDIRKPKVMEGLGLKRKLGITNYIIGRAELADIIIPVPGFDSLYVIGCGPIPPNPAELLLDKRLDELMAEVRANFDVVLMDTAPVGLVSDSMTLGKFSDCTLFIVRVGHTYRKILRLVEDIYQEKRLPGLSLVINDVKLEGGYYSGYYGGHGYYGGYGYGIESGYFEKPAGKKQLPVRLRIGRWFAKWFG